MKKKSLPIVSAVFLVIAMTVQFFVSYHREKADLMQQMEYKMDLAQKDFIFEMYNMHEATDEIVHFFPEFDDHTDELYALLEAVLGHYQDLYCCYVTFLPECSPTPGQWSCPTAFRVLKDSIITYDPGNHISYAQRDWYIGALNSDEEGYWSLPYNDGTHEDPVFTYSQKVFDGKGKLIGVAGADYTLDPNKAPLLTTMLAYQNIAHGQPTQIVDRNNEYTSQVLLRLGFQWTEPDNEYIGRMLTAISQLGFFDI